MLIVSDVSYLADIQGESEGTFNTSGGNSIGHCEGKVHMNVCLILNCYRDRTVWIRRFLVVPPSSSDGLDVCLWDWIKSEGCKRNVDTRYEFLACILDAAARVEKREDQLRLTTRDLRTRVTKCVEVDGGIFEHLLWTVTNLSFLCNSFVI
jgi:hypothetical protein